MDNEPFPPAGFFGAGWKLTFDHKPEFGGVSGGRSVVKDRDRFCVSFWRADWRHRDPPRRLRRFAIKALIQSAPRAPGSFWSTFDCPSAGRNP
jgi:hypothetical protein